MLAVRGLVGSSLWLHSRSLFYATVSFTHSFFHLLSKLLIFGQQFHHGQVLFQAHQTSLNVE